MVLSKLEKDMSIIQKLDDEPNDVGGLTAAELKAKFDEAGIALKEYLNEILLPELEEAGVLSILRTDDDTVLKYIRLNADKVLETSADGERWESTGSGGHLILGPDGYEMPQRVRLRFTNCEVTDDGSVTIVRAGKGADGTPCTHFWNGTTLTVTSASGTSSANLKGEKGEAGANGKDGADGKTPVKGVDYYTVADKAAMVADVLAALPSADEVSY